MCNFGKIYRSQEDIGIVELNMMLLLKPLLQDKTQAVYSQQDNSDVQDILDTQHSTHWQDRREERKVPGSHGANNPACDIV